MLQVLRVGSRGCFRPIYVSDPKEKQGKEKKDESPVMAIDQEQDSEVTSEIKIDEIDGARPVSRPLRLKRMFLRSRNCHQKQRSRDGLPTVDVRNS